MWTWVTRSSPLKDRTITDLVFMQTYSNHGALHAFYIFIHHSTSRVLCYIFLSSLNDQKHHLNPS